MESEDKVSTTPLVHNWKDTLLLTQNETILNYNLKNQKLESKFQHSSLISFIATNPKTNYVAFGYEKKISIYLVEKSEWKLVHERFGFFKI
jgi:hypothetical protein